MTPHVHAELKEAAKDPTKQIRIKGRDWYGDWYGVGEYTWRFDYPVECYEIRDKPKAKVKMWQWIVKGGSGRYYMNSTFYKDEPNLTGLVQRAEWTMIEVEE